IRVDENGLPIERRSRAWPTLIGLAAIAGAAAAGYFGMKHLPIPIESAEASSAVAPAPTRSPQPSAAERPIEVAQANGTNKTTTTTTTFGGWTVSCNEGGTPPRKVCSANFRVMNKENRANVLVWVIGFNAQGALLSEFLTLTDVQIQPGVNVTFDEGTPVKADYVECTTNSCKARLAMSPDLIRELKAASKSTIEMTRLDGQVLRFQMEIPGVGEAMAELGV